jgi:hypothetical protein
MAATTMRMLSRAAVTSGTRVLCGVETLPRCHLAPARGWIQRPPRPPTGNRHLRSRHQQTQRQGHATTHSHLIAWTQTTLLRSPALQAQCRRPDRLDHEHHHIEAQEKLHQPWPILNRQHRCACGRGRLACHGPVLTSVPRLLKKLKPQIACYMMPRLGSQIRRVDSTCISVAWRLVPKQDAKTIARVRRGRIALRMIRKDRRIAMQHFGHVISPLKETDTPGMTSIASHDLSCARFDYSSMYVHL